MSEIRIDIKTSGDAEPIKKVAEAAGALNTELAKDSNAQANALTELSAAAKTAEDALQRVKEVSLADAFDPNAGLATPAGNLPDQAPTNIPLTVEDVGAIEKAAAQLERKIAVMQAVNEETAKESALLEKLNAALATEEALAIKSAQADERRAEAKKKVEEAAKVQSFKVDSEAGVAAVEKEVASLQRKIITTRAAGESASDLEARLAKLNAALGTEEAKTIIASRAQRELAEAQTKAAQSAEKEAATAARTTAIKANSEATKELTGRNRDLRNAAQGLNIEFPILGRVISALTSPVSAALGAVALLIGGLRQLWKELNRVEEFSNPAKWETLSSGSNKAAETLTSAQIAAEAFARGLGAAATAQDTLAISTEKVIAKIREQARAELEIKSAQAALETAKIDSDEKNGRISAVEAIRRRAKVVSDLEAAKITSANATQKKEIETRQGEKRAIEKKIPKLQDDAEQTAAAALEIRQREERFAQVLKDAEKNKETAKSNEVRLKEKLEDAEESSGSALDKASPFTAIGRKIANLKQLIEISKSDQETADKVLKSGANSATSRGNDKKLVEEADTRAAKALTEAIVELNKLTRLIPDLQSKAKSDSETRGAVGTIAGQTRSVQTQTALDAETKKEADQRAREEKRQQDAREKYEKDLQHAVQKGLRSPPEPVEEKPVSVPRGPTLSKPIAEAPASFPPSPPSQPSPPSREIPPSAQPAAPGLPPPAPREIPQPQASSNDQAATALNRVATAVGNSDSGALVEAVGNLATAVALKDQKDAAREAKVQTQIAQIISQLANRRT